MESKSLTWTQIQFGGHSKQRQGMYFSTVTKEKMSWQVSALRDAARPSGEGERNAGMRLECWGRAVEDLWEALVLLQLMGRENSVTGNLWP